MKPKTGYLFLLMERMESDLLHKVEEMAVNCDMPAVSVGPLASRMIDLIQSIHSVNQLVIDIKPQNFMFARTSRKRSSSTQYDDASKLTDRLRLVDFGLMRAFKRQEEVPDLHGTALYASLHMHTLQSGSRRDDLEMVCYVIGEILIRVRATVDGTKESFEQTTIPSYLPWSQETSDERLYRAKAKQVKDPTSEFYQRMSLDAARILHQCLELIWSYKFRTEPDYEAIKGMMSSLSVPNNKRGDQKKLTATRTRNTKTQVCRSEDVVPVQSPSDRILRLRRTQNSSSTPLKPVVAPVRTVGTQTEDEEGTQPGSKRQKTAAQRSHGTRADRDKNTQTDLNQSWEEGTVDLMEVDDVFDDGPAERKSSAVEVVEIVDDNDIEIENKKANIQRETGALSIKLVIHAPGQGDMEYIMTKDETLFLGTKPVSPDNTKDKENSTWIEVHGGGSCRLTLKIKRNRIVHAVVKDLKKPGTVYVGRSGITRKIAVKKGGESECMIPGQIYVGTSVIQLHRR